MTAFWRHPLPLPMDEALEAPHSSTWNETTTQMAEAMDAASYSPSLNVDAEAVRAFVEDMGEITLSNRWHDSSCIGRVCLNPEHADEEATAIDVPVIAYGGIARRGDLTDLRMVDDLRKRMLDTRREDRK